MTSSMIVVQISDGKLQGREWEISNGDKIWAFLGIPYAKTPVGDLRFKEPYPVDAWEGIRDATKDGDGCISEEFLTHIAVGSEDCLFVNVFTKSLNADKLKPVMVYIHGGAFIGGSNKSETHSPDFLLTEDIVLVTINYRLGIFGFLNLNDSTLGIPGNAGLKDQSLALKWVQKNIRNFGGDPNNVTLFGESAGSASVHYHILSSVSKGLFHKAILMSGSVHNPWPYGTASLLDVLKVSGVTFDDEAEGLDYIKKLSTQELFDIQSAYLKLKGDILRIFGPVVEKHHPTAFITREPVEIIASGDYNKVPMVLGYCNMESLLFESEAMKKFRSRMETEKPTLEKRLSAALGLFMDSELLKTVARKIEQFYISSRMEHGEVMLFSDLLFIAGIIASAKLHASTNPSPVYLYRFSLVAGLNMFNVFTKLSAPGASHADDMGYLFRSRLPVPPYTLQYEKESIEELSIKRMVKLWTNFAKFSNPTPEPETNDSDLGLLSWKQMDKEHDYYLDINKSLSLGIDPEQERMLLWKEIGDLLSAHDFKISGSYCK